jgi:hypothetical protein
MFTVYLISLHTLPLICCFVNIMITKIIFLRGDYKFSMSAGMIYMIFNGFGTLEIGHELYGCVPWDNFSSTVGMFVFQSILLGIIHYISAVCMQKTHSY